MVTESNISLNLISCACEPRVVLFVCRGMHLKSAQCQVLTDRDPFKKIFLPLMVVEFD